MGWPTPQDFNEAVQWPEGCFDDEELRQGSPELNNMGLPRAVCGNFAAVYQFYCPKRSVAVKCFLRDVKDQYQRYARLAQFMAANDVDSLVQFDYLKKGILVEGEWYPIVKMQWVEGLQLDHFLRKYMFHRPQMDRVIMQFCDVVRELTQVEMGHGDLQHGNIIVRPNDLMLVDYDGNFVPAMAGQESSELGHANYQHPGRGPKQFDAKIDRFSAWIIYHTLHVLRLDPTLWQRHAGGDECLLFRRQDFLYPSGSRLLQELEQHPVPEIKLHAKALRELLETPYDALPKFDPKWPPMRLTQDNVKASSPHLTVFHFEAPVSVKDPGAGVVRWPALEEFKNSLMNHGPKIFADNSLKQGRFLYQDTIVGKNGVIFRIALPDKHYAIKCFLRDAADRKFRYEAISKHDMSAVAKYLVSFQYQSNGIVIDNNAYPLLKMPWIEGMTLEHYICMQLKFANKQEIEDILSDFRDMVDAMLACGIAHGDLDPENILVNHNGALKMVDYDAMYVPALAHLQACEKGNAMYQHPSRTLGHYGPYLDNFPALVIDSILSCMTMMPPERMWRWSAFMQQLAPSKNWQSSPTDDAIARVGRQIKEMQKYRIDQVPALKSSRSL